MGHVRVAVTAFSSQASCGKVALKESSGLGEGYAVEPGVQHEGRLVELASMAKFAPQSEVSVNIVL
jgi:hypothetical protein